VEWKEYMKKNLEKEGAREEKIVGDKRRRR
jgi:hypothetical protein